MAIKSVFGFLSYVLAVEKTGFSVLLVTIYLMKTQFLADFCLILKNFGFCWLITLVS